MAGFLGTGTRKGAWLTSKMGSSRNDSFTKDQRGWRPTSDGPVSIQELATILILDHRPGVMRQFQNPVQTWRLL
jgi:hypothetical protein